MPRCFNRPRVALWVAPLALVIAICVGAGAAQAAFPGANGRVAYLNDAAQIFVSNADGTGVVGPLNPPDFPVSPPRLSPDGRQLVFSATVTAGGNTTINVMVMSVDGSTSRWVTGEDPRTYDIWPDWTPDGRIVFSRTDASFVSGGIWSVAADGSGIHQLTTGQDQHVAAAPDGTLAFNRYPASGPGAIFVAGADGSSPHQLVNLPSNLQVDSANWAPDSSKVAFDVADPVNDTAGGIYVIKADGTGQTRILGNGAGSHPAFSPDGTRIVYTMPDASQQTGVGVMNADGSGSQMIAPPANGHTFLAPDWGVAVPAPPPPPPPPPPVKPTVTNVHVGRLGLTSVTLVGSVNPNGSALTECQFWLIDRIGSNDLQYHKLCSPSVVSGTNPVTVSATFPMFQSYGSVDPRETYDVSLVATNAGGYDGAYGSNLLPQLAYPGASAVRAALATALAPRGGGATISAVLKHDGYKQSVKALSPGKVTIAVYDVPRLALLKTAVARATKHKRKPVLVAVGRRTFSKAGTAKVTIKLTPAGKRLLRHAKRVKLTAVGRFKPTGRTAITATKTFMIRR